jgi:hypothetical protein
MGLESLLAGRMFGAYNKRLFVFVDFKLQTDGETEKRMLAWKAKTNFAGEKGSLQKYLTNAARDQSSEGVRDRRDMIQSPIEGLPRIMAIENTNPEIAPLTQGFQLRHGT